MPLAIQITGAYLPRNSPANNSGLGSIKLSYVTRHVSNSALLRINEVPLLVNKSLTQTNANGFIG